MIFSLTEALARHAAPQHRLPQPRVETERRVAVVQRLAVVTCEKGLGFRVLGVGCGVLSAGLRVEGLGLRVEG